MPTGSRSCRVLGAPHATPARGFTYLVLLFGVALVGVAMAAIGPQWQVQAQRQREAELLFRGQQLREALRRYAAATPTGQPARPATLDALLSDERSRAPQHHLRRLWPDPFTGRADWVLLRDAAGGIVGLHSTATRAPRWRQPLPDGVFAPDGGARRLADWVFAVDAAALAQARPDAAAGAATPATTLTDNQTPARPRRSGPSPLAQPVSRSSPP